MTDNKPDGVIDAQRKDAGAIATSHQMMRLLEIQALSVNMNNAASAQQNAYTLNTAIISSICKRIITARKQAVKQ